MITGRGVLRCPANENVCDGYFVDGVFQEDRPGHVYMERNLDEFITGLEIDADDRRRPKEEMRLTLRQYDEDKRRWDRYREEQRNKVYPFYTPS